MTVSGLLKDSNPLLKNTQTRINFVRFPCGDRIRTRDPLTGGRGPNQITTLTYTLQVTNFQKYVPSRINDYLCKFVLIIFFYFSAIERPFIVVSTHFHSLKNLLQHHEKLISYQTFLVKNEVLVLWPILLINCLLILLFLLQKIGLKLNFQDFFYICMRIYPVLRIPRPSAFTYKG